MEYWIVIDKERFGPMSFDELKQNPKLEASTYVWGLGLPSWQHAEDIKELRSIFHPDYNPDTDESGKFISIMPLDSTDVQKLDTTQIVNPVENPDFTSEATKNTNAQKEASHQWYDYSKIPDPTNCPPTFLVLSIVMLLCCCQLFGIIAVIYAAQVRSAFLSGQTEKAERYSRNALIWCIVSLFAGLFYIPVSILWSIYSPLF